MTRARVDGSGKFGGRTTVVTCTFVLKILQYTLYCVCVITSGRTRGTAAEENAIGKQQLATEADTIGKQQAEAGAIGEQQLKQTQRTVLGAA